MAVAGIILAAAGTILSAVGQHKQALAAENIGLRKQQEAEFEAQQLDVDAGQSEAVSQRGAADVARQESYLQSTVLARAAASGAGASDDTVNRLSATIAGESAYRQGLALYEGSAQSRLDRARAQALRMTGDIGMAGALETERAGNITAASTVLAGGANVASMYKKYYGGPRPTSTPDDPGALNTGADTGGDIQV